MENKTKCYCGHTIYCDCNPLEQPKQETLEEAAEKLYPKTKNQVIDFANELRKEGFLKGAKWQKEQDKKLYNEEELLRFGKSCFYKGFDKAENDDANCYTAFREEISSLFEQFKKNKL